MQAVVIVTVVALRCIRVIWHGTKQVTTSRNKINLPYTNAGGVVGISAQQVTAGGCSVVVVVAFVVVYSRLP